MSKLYSIYSNYKKQNKETILLFKSGIFYIALDKDALFLSNIFNFKLTNLNNSIVKCGFPQNSLQKYLTLFENNNINFEIVDSVNYTLNSYDEYKNHENIKKILEKIKKVNIDLLSVTEAYDFIENLQNDLKSIIF